MCGKHVMVMVAGLMFAAVALAAPATDDGDAATTRDGPGYVISAVVLEYLQDHPKHPSLSEVVQTEVVLGRIDGGYVAPREGVPSVTMTVAEIADRPAETYYASAVQTIILAVLDFFTVREFMGVYVAPHPGDISRSGRDIRTNGDTRLRLVITTGIVSELRTLAAGERIKPEERINHPLHARIRERSPLKPYSLGEGDTERHDLLQREALDRYLFHLSRHPGRRVDASVSASEVPGGVTLDYFVTENKPLTFYFQVANTGTDQTGAWRERFGLTHTQLTNYDDILTLDFDTNGFDGSNAFFGSYERPFKNDRWRWRVFGAWNEFTADQVGFSNLEFTGESATAGGQLLVNVFQRRELFIDLVAGMRWLSEEVDSPIFGNANGDFLLGEAGLRLERSTEWFRTEGSLQFEWTLANDVSSEDLEILGRSGPDDNWVVLRGSASHSMFLEPLINGKAWRDPTTPQSSTLAHELILAIRGQYAFDNRLIPQVQEIVGGLYTVRGYRQAAVAGDSTVIGSVEYRFHVPRSLGVQPEPARVFGRTFRVAPQYVYGRPDWDLIFKGFVDFGATWQSDALPFENDETLIGAGIGAELLILRNLNIRVDWAWALKDVDSAGISSGSSQVYFVATLLF